MNIESARNKAVKAYVENLYELSGRDEDTTARRIAAQIYCTVKQARQLVREVVGK